MKLEDQVCSLDLAKKLKKLGVKQDGIWSWCCKNRKWSLEWSDSNEPIKATEYASAFTVAEIGEMLPIAINGGKAGKSISSELLSLHKGTFGVDKNEPTKWQVMYCDVKWFNEIKEADARAKMLIYLFENHLIGDTSARSSNERDAA